MYHLAIDLIYWQAQVGGLAFASEKKACHPHFRWDPGFRIEGGYALEQQGWDLSLAFTHYYTKAFGDCSGNLFPTWSNPLFFESEGYADEAEIRWRLHYGQFDLFLGKKLELSSTISARPFFGLRTACIRQKMKFGYAGGSLFPCGKELISSKNKFLGTGLVGGVEGRAALGKGWSLFATGALALLYGEIYVHESEKATVGERKRLSLHDTFNTTTPVIDLGGGLGWHAEHWGIDLSWEEHLYFGQNELVRFIDNKAQGAYVSHLGDLCLQGAVLGAYWEY